MTGNLTPAEGLVAAAMSRRTFTTLTGAAAALALGGHLTGVAPTRAAAVPPPKTDPFTLGVASGDPLPDGVVIWTRLAYDPRAPRGGMPERRFSVGYEVAADENFRHVVARGTARAEVEWSHSIHVDVRGLRPSADYWYRFKAGRYISPVGRTRTAPAADAMANSLTLAVASCQAIWEGWFTAYDDLVARDHDAVLFLGDYIYEFGVNRGVRPEDGDPANTRFCETLDEYRDRYAQYKTDPSLQAAHAACPWIVTFDDHEIHNNWADENGPKPVEEFLVQRANGFRAYWEHMPLRVAQRPVGPDILMYRRLKFGNLAELSMLDTRSYRSDQANGDGIKPPNGSSADPARTITGDAQEKWLLDGMAASSAKWNLMGQQTAMTRMDFSEGEDVGVLMDTWDGYEASRDRVLGGLVDRGVDNIVTLGGDIHRSVASNLTLDFDNPAASPVAAEFIATSVTSGGDGAEIDPPGATMLAESPHVKFANFKRGYSSVTITPDKLTVDHRILDRVQTPGGSASTRTSLTVLDGRPGLQEA